MNKDEKAVDLVEARGEARDLFDMATAGTNPSGVNDLQLAVLAYKEGVLEWVPATSLEDMLDPNRPYTSLGQLAYPDRLDLHGYLRDLDEGEKRYGRVYVLEKLLKFDPHLLPFISEDRKVIEDLENHFHWARRIKARFDDDVYKNLVSVSDYAVSKNFDLRSREADFLGFVLTLANVRLNERSGEATERAREGYLNVFDLYKRGAFSGGKRVRSMAAAAPYSAIMSYSDALDRSDDFRRLMVLPYMRSLSNLWRKYGSAMDRIIGSEELCKLMGSSKSPSQAYDRLDKNWTAGRNYRKLFLTDGCWKNDGKAPDNVWPFSHVKTMYAIYSNIDDDVLLELRRSVA